jgi:hypothetical protein
VDLYIADIHEQLRSELSAKGHMLTALNENITSSLSKVISNSTKQHLATTHTTCDASMSDLAIDCRNDEIQESENETTYVCPICNKISLDETIECSECSLWIHYECAGLSQSAVRALNSLDFICALFTDNMLYTENTTPSVKAPHALNVSTDTHLEVQNIAIQDGQQPCLDASHKLEISDDEEDFTLLKQCHNANDNKSMPSSMRNNQIQPQVISNNQNIRSPVTLIVEQQVPSDNVQKKPKRPVAKSAKPKINSPEDKAYIIKLENEINKLKSTIEIQDNLSSYQHQSSVPQFTTTCTQDPSLINTQNTITSIESKINNQRFRMLEFQMMQNMTMNNMISNQQMQIMMQQQQMTQQSYAHPNYGQPLYPTIPMLRVIPPPPGFLQNTMPPNYPYNGMFTPAFGPHQHVNSNLHLIRTHPGTNQHVNYQNPHLPHMHSRATYQNTNQQPMYGSTQNQRYEHISRGARVNIPPHNVHVSHPDTSRLVTE